MNVTTLKSGLTSMSFLIHSVQAPQGASGFIARSQRTSSRSSESRSVRTLSASSAFRSTWLPLPRSSEAAGRVSSDAGEDAEPTEEASSRMSRLP